MTTGRRLALLVAVTGMALGPPARAQSPRDEAEARAHDKSGRDDIKARRYDEAIAHFQAAYQLAPRPELLFNIARAYQLKGDRRQALEYYRRYLEGDPRGEAAGKARGYVETLTRELAAAGPEAAPASQPAAPAAAPAPATEVAVTQVAATAPAAPPPVSSAVEPIVARARPGGLSFGAEAGVAITHFDTDLPSDTKLGLAIGAFLAYAPLDWLAVRADLLFVQKGDVYPTEDITNSINYIELPLLAQISLGGAHVFFGPYLAVKVGADTNFNDSLSGTDLGAALGAGYGFPVGPGTLAIELRYDYGLVEIDENYRTHTRAVVIGVAYGYAPPASRP